MYLSRHFILVEIIRAKNSETKFTKNPVKIVSQGNQSINFNMGKMKFDSVISYFPLLKLNDGFLWEKFWQDFSGKDRNLDSDWLAVLWIRIRIGSVFRSFLDPDPDPHMQI